MSYSCSDVVSDTEDNLRYYGARVIPATALEDCDPATSESDGLRLLSERIAAALADRRMLLAALQTCVTYRPPAFFRRGGKAAARVAEINAICDAVIASATKD
jgi:hypothetical protein